MVTVPPPFSVWHAAGRRLTGRRKTVVFFAPIRMEPGVQGTVFLFRGWICIQVEPGMDFWTNVKVLVHEGVHAVMEDIPVCTAAGTFAWYGKPKRVPERLVYAREAEIMAEVTRRFNQSKWKTVDGGLFSVVPGLRKRMEEDVLSFVQLA